MWTRRDIARAGGAIIATLAGWGAIRLLVPSLDYFTPDSLVQALERSWIVNAGLRKAAAAGYLAVALVLMAILFKAVQQRWPGRAAVKGLVFGTAIGVAWSIGFLTGSVFLETTLRADILNVISDLFPLAIAGWLIGLAVGLDVEDMGQRTPRPWLAGSLVAVGFLLFHSLGTMLAEDFVGAARILLLVPTEPLQFALIAALGLWAGCVYVVLREGLPFASTWARVAFFAFGVVGLAWAWFHMFFLIEFAGVLHALLLVGLLGPAGIFLGALAYERIARVTPG